jgi:hypothetical protein
MGIYDSMYKETFKELAYKEVLNIIVGKIEKSGLTVSEESKKGILSNLRDGMSSFTIEEEHGEAHSITFNEDDYRLLNERLSKIIDLSGNANFLLEISASTASDILEGSMDNWAEYACQKDESTKAFIEELHEYWDEPIKYLRMLRTVFYEQGELAVVDIGKSISKGGRNDSPSLKLSVLLHARICQLLEEIITLIRCGYSEGAMARWRTLHEINVVANFILERDDDLAERYLLHDAVESYRAAKDYKECFEKLGYDPISDEEFSQAENRVNELVDRFGKSYRGSYGWAADALNKKNPSFTDIAKATGFDHLKAHYRLASHGVHANPKGFTYRMSQPYHTKALIAGPSVYGLADPISCAAITASQLFAVLNTQWCSVDSLIALKAIMILMEKVNTSVENVALETSDSAACYDE